MPTFANTINGNEILAKRSQCDYAGNDIQTTYATKTEVTTGLASKEDSSNKAQSINANSTTDFPSSKATADFVNSSVATNTAKFLGNFTLTDLSLTYPATDAQIETALDGYTFSPAPTNNDYVYVEIQDPQTPGVTDVVKRFKFDGTSWLYEYSLNNSSFTAAEIAAIDSGVTSTKVTAYDTHVADTDIHVTLSDKSTWNGKQDAISDLATIRSGAQAGATAVQPGDLSTVATTGAYSDLTGTPSIPTATSDLTNDSGFITLSDVPAQVNADWNAVSGAAEILHKPSIPSATSDLTNDSGFITLSDVPAQVNADWNAVSGAAEILNKPSIPPALSAGNGIDITNNVVSADLDGTSLTNGANGLSVTLPVPDTTSASQGDVLSVGQNGIEWATPTVSSNNVYRATSTTTFTDLWQAYHVDHKVVYYSEGNDGRAYYLQELKANDSSYVDGRATFILFNRYSTGRIETYYCEKWLQPSTTLGSLSFTRQTIIPDNPSSHAGELVTPNSSGNMVYTTVNGLPASTVSDEGKLLTVNSSGNAEWASAQSPISAGDGIDITSNVVSAKVDGTTIDTNASGELTVIGGGGGTQADWTEDDPTDPSYIENKPTPKTLTAGTNITVTENSSTITISATWQNAQADWTENDPNEPAYIQHKPTIPTVDQTYDGTSANAQSGVAVASGISDAVAALPTNLTSAQIQALKEALGVDETVLFENASGIGTGTQLVLSEAYTNFEKLQFVYKTWTDDTVDVNTFGSDASIFTLVSGWTSSSLYAVFITTYTATDATHLDVTKCGFNNVTGGAWTTTNANYRLYKVVGIHRIAQNSPSPSPEPDPDDSGDIEVG